MIQTKLFNLLKSSNCTLEKWNNIQWIHIYNFMLILFQEWWKTCFQFLLIWWKRVEILLCGRKSATYYHWNTRILVVISQGVNLFFLKYYSFSTNRVCSSFSSSWLWIPVMICQHDETCRLTTMLTACWVEEMPWTRPFVTHTRVTATHYQVINTTNNDTFPGKCWP